MTTYPETPFASSRGCFDQLVSALSGGETAQLDHEEVERLIESGGRELLLQLMQDHLDLRSVREKTTIKPMRGVDGVERTEIRRSSRLLGTLFGPVGVQRIALVKRGVSGGRG